MASTANQWSNARRSSFKVERWSWDLTLWLGIALVMAVVFHIWLFYVFQNLELRADHTPAPKKTPERLYINQMANEQVVHDIPDQIAPAEPPQTKADLTDVAPMIPPNTPMDLTPEVNKVTNFLSPDRKSQSVTPAQGPSLAALADSLPSPDPTASSASSLKPILSKAVSANQLVIPGRTVEKELEGLDSKLLDRLHQKDAGNRSNRTLAGYSNLDELIAQGSGVSAGTRIAIPTDLLFEYGSADLADTARLSLMKLGYLIMKNPRSKFTIEGHTDNFGTEGFNLELSQRRANAVVVFLMNSLHLSMERVEAVGFGKSRPLVRDGTVEEQAPNRRVEIKVRPL